jgi:hypothetical protein
LASIPSILLKQRTWIPYVVLAGIMLAFFVATAVSSTYLSHHLGDSAYATGYTLFGFMIFLIIFNARKRLSMLPIFKVRWWTPLHIASGILVMALFWLHIGTLWPDGLYEQAITLIFYLVSLSGLFGYVVLRVYPGWLTQTDTEIIYEEVPSIIAGYREEAERLILECTKETRSDTLARYYTETLDWFFRRPHFIMNHLLGGRKGIHWVNQHISTARRYLNDTEREYLDKLNDLASRKNRIDFHFAIQSVMKMWLLIHVPASVALLLMALWHLLLVNIYSL